LAFDLPELLHHELEIRRLDPAATYVRIDRDAVCDARRADAADSHLVENRLDQSRLSRHLLAAKLVVAPERPDDRCPRRITVEKIESQIVGEEAGDATPEDVEPRKLVVADSEHDIDTEPRPRHQLRQHV